MKIAKAATLDEITQKTWAAFSADAGLGAPYVRRRVKELAETIREAAPIVGSQLTETRLNEEALARFASLLASRAERVLKTV
ncbi:hypothetical protein BH24ACI5_BH24ACI5_19360 [soil metagenome]